MDRKIGKRINFLMNHHRAYANDSLKPYNLTYSEAHILLNIYHYECLSQDELGRLLLIDKARISRVIAQLEDKGYILKKQSNKDRRYFDVSLSQKGKDSMLLIKSILDKSSEKMLHGMKGNDVEKLIKLLDLMCMNVGGGYYINE